jgi:hypothetical protein
MLGEQYGFGDLDGDSDIDAAVMLITQSGGSGTFYTLAAVLDDNGTPVHRGSAFLGDRIMIESVAIDNGQITVELVTQGPDDPMSRPTIHTTRTFVLIAGELSESNTR